MINSLSKTNDFTKTHKMLRVCVLCPLRGSSVDLPVATAYGGLCVVATFLFSRYSDYTILSWYKAYMKTGYTTQNATPPLGCDLRSAAAQALSPEGSCYLPCCYRSSADMPQSRACARCLRATCWCRESSRVHSSSHECSRINSPYCRRTVP